MVEPIFQQSDVEILKGDPTVYTFHSSGSGRQVHVHFCSQCGTKIFLSFERFPSVVGVYAGAFDNPSWFDRAPETTACLFVDSAAAGAMVPAGVPVYRQHRSTLDGAPNEAVIFEAPHLVKRGE